MYTTLNHRSPVQWLVRKGVGVLPTAGNEAVTSEWRSADILAWNTEVNENHSQLPTQEQRTKTLGTCLSSMYTCVPSCEIPAVQGRLSHHSMPEGLHGHQISDAWLCLLLHRSLFWNLITNAHPCWTTSFRISSATQGEDRWPLLHMQCGESPVNMPMLGCHLCSAASHTWLCIYL